MMTLSSILTDADPSDPKIGEAVLENIRLNANASADNPVHPSLLIFLARKLTVPVIQCDETPRLLDVLTSLESVRGVLVEHVRTALRLQQKSTESRERGIIPLPKSDVKKLRGYIDEKRVSTLRLIFREDILFNLYRLHICYLWVSSEPSSIVKFMKRYFPSNYARVDDPFADHLWGDSLYTGFSRKERERVHSVGEEMKKLLMKCRTWDLEREYYFRKLGVSEDVAFGESDFISYSRDFNAKFRTAIDEGSLQRSLAIYLNKIETLVDTLERLFPNARREAEHAESLS